jgi:sugar phosphate isomerase/epimerase
MTGSPRIRPVGIAHLTVLDLPPVELVKLSAEAGFTSVGLRLFAAYPGAPTYSLPVGSPVLRELRDLLRATSQRVYDIETITIDPGFSLDGIEAVFESGRILGAQRVTVSGDDADTARLVANFAELCDLACRYGLGIDMENLGWRSVSTFSDALAVVRAADRPNGAVMIDALHFFRNGGRIEDLRGVPAALLRSVQLCDAPARSPATKEEKIAEARAGRLPPGEGTLDLAGMLAALPSDIALSVEAPMAEAMEPGPRLKHIHAATLKFLSSPQ